tara:strand:+ start:365 stop:580 length:216 start_codon:yes stop_codon:yes gene_type:complete
MAYIVIKKDLIDAKIFGSLPLVSNYTGLTKNQLRVIFSNKKKTEFENNEFKFFRCNIIVGGKKRAGYLPTP